MRIFIEGESYSLDILKPIFGDKFYMPNGVNGIIDNVGYYHSIDNEVIYLLPKVFIDTKGSYHQEYGYCIRTGVRIPFDVKKPFSYEAYQTWAIFENWNYRENYCHKTGKESNGRTSMANPIL